ncbi:MAG: hypothetical protein A2W93_10715 [Bacteroidetes bacterium GWF2_43_63]|nr:MAG: hypothetical protein A2W94_01745 [Bacteroidetes bacterium GWE2_42_42]OFY52985.1 MAG: hypothetical protein A2W93_10715 [Bacteroidetes bacterium GWF2_43_63]HCB62190.1 hypothetical protein [Bacteroidales bacterium]
MKILMIIGNEPNQRALANKIHAEFPLSAIITESRKSKRKITLRKVFEKIIERLFLSSIDKAWFGLHTYYKSKYPDFPDVPNIDVENINKDPAYQFAKKIHPDLIIVSGTRLVKNPMLQLPAGNGIMNIHTGLSPYIKGGPNCTNWCLATNQPEYIGNTIMWIDQGIDSGKIIASDTVDISGAEDLMDIHIRVMDHAHALCINAIKAINARQNKEGVDQNSIAKGKTYYTKEWGLRQKISLVKNTKRILEKNNPNNFTNSGLEIVTINPNK